MILTVITAIEVAVFYVPALKPMLVPILLVLSAVKFALVAMFYMHLKFDHKLFSWLFVVPMVWSRCSSSRCWLFGHGEVGSGPSAAGARVAAERVEDAAEKDRAPEVAPRGSFGSGGWI